MINANINDFATVKGKVELFDGDTPIATCTCSDRLAAFSVERIGVHSKFFGFSYCQKITIELIDLERNLTLQKGNIVKVMLGDGTTFVSPFPTFYIEDVARKEDTNEIIVTAYDAMYRATSGTVSGVSVEGGSYTIAEFARACGAFLGVSVALPTDASAFATLYETGANFGGEESVRSAIDAIAEATQTIAFVSPTDALTFKQLPVADDVALTITKEDYFTLTTSAPVTIGGICSATELGENVEATTGNGITQFVRDNPFWNLRTDVAALVSAAVGRVAGTSITPFVCDEWMGNYLLEIGDKIALQQENGEVVTSYYLDGVVTFDGTLSDTTKWTYDKTEDETATNPTSLDDALNLTFARVDKQKGQIELVARKADAAAETLGGLADDLAELKKEVALKVDSNNVSIAIQQELKNGVEKVVTKTGFTFDENGLHIEKTDSEMTSTLDEAGLSVKRSGTDVLTATNDGVNALNITVRQYLLIGGRSRLENYESNRTGCFWIGG